MRTATVVDGPITIVINVVATNLAHRECLLCARCRSVGAMERATGAWPKLTRHRAGAATTRIAFVDDVVAIVVEAIADFIRRKHRLGTKQRPVLTLIGAGCANAEFTRNHAGHARRAFIRGAVAIVVDTIACFSLGHRRLLARDRTVAARTRPQGTSPLKPRHTRLAAAGIAIVDHAVAIVVLAVADFCSRHRIRFALERTGRAIERSLGTCTGQTSGAHDAATGVTFVGRVIAVVIDAVADFGHRHTWHTSLRNASGTSLHGHLTAAHTTRQRAQVIVDEKVAIVIDTIARFVFWRSRRTRRHHSIHASVHRDQTSTGATGDLGNVFVFHAVAIVIAIVTGLDGRQNFVDAGRPRTIRARLRSFFAITDAGRAIASGITRPFVAFRHAGTIDVVIDLSIAIFVGPIAGFIFGRTRCTRRNHSINATVDHHRARAFAARDWLEVFVELTIAVVIELVADFVARNDLAGTSTPLPFGTGLRAVFAHAHPLGSSRSRITRLRGPFGTAHHSAALPAFTAHPANTARGARATLAGSRRRSRVSTTKGERSQKNGKCSDHRCADGCTHGKSPQW